MVSHGQFSERARLKVNCGLVYLRKLGPSYSVATKKLGEARQQTLYYNTYLALELKSTKLMISPTSKIGNYSRKKVSVIVLW